jgi:hypothetical protein
MQGTAGTRHGQDREGVRVDPKPRPSGPVAVGMASAECWTPRDQRPGRVSLACG